MRSALADKDLTAQARIRDAAIRLFGERGYHGASIRAIATGAGVSPALVVHHFGSKERLRQACDEHLAEAIRAAKTEAVTQQAPDPVQLLRTAGEAQPLLRYLARTLVDGSPGAAQLVDTLVADAVAYTAQGVQSGALKPTEEPYARAVVLCMWQLGALALHAHVERLLNVDLLEGGKAMLEWSRPAVEILTHGLFTDDRWEKAVRAAKQYEEDDSTQEGSE